MKARALQWLAQREHSRSELRAKLLRFVAIAATASRRSGADAPGADDDAADPAPQVDALLDWLESHGHLSQARFVESRVHARQARFGNLRITRELLQHGVELDAAQQLALQGSELQRAQEVWRRRYGAPAEDVAGRARQMRFLAGRGFSPEVVRRVVRGEADPEDT